MTKPKDSVSTTTWKLVKESHYFHDLEEQLENKPELVETIETLINSKSNIPDLANNLLYYVSEAEGIEESLSKEISILQERKSRFKKRADNIRDVLKTVMERFDIKKLECPYGTISQVTRKASKLNITDEGEILMNYPELYIRQEPKLDKIALKSLLETGVVIEGVELIDSSNIMIRK